MEIFDKHSLYHGILTVYYTICLPISCILTVYYKICLPILWYIDSSILYNMFTYIMVYWRYIIQYVYLFGFVEESAKIWSSFKPQTLQEQPLSIYLLIYLSIYLSIIYLPNYPLSFYLSIWVLLSNYLSLGLFTSHRSGSGSKIKKMSKMSSHF